MIEVELKARVRDSETLLRRLRRLAEEEFSTYLDTYYDWPGQRLTADGRELRIRVMDTGGLRRAVLTYKEPAIDTGSGSKPEHETEGTSVFPVKRVAIIGCGRSGKTTIGRQIANAIDAPITHLDAVYFDDDWSTMQPEKFTALQEELVAADRWVIDGNYASTLPVRLKRADTVIFLDLPAMTCLWGIAQRRWRYRGGRHDATGVYYRITWSFIKYVRGYRRQMAPRVRRLIAEHAQHADVRITTSRRAANQMLLRLKGNGVA